MTDAEYKFWDMVKNRKMLGLKFRRQQVIDGFIVDFYCDSLGLCVEIDGEIHTYEKQVVYDKAREDVLELRGLHVIRFKNDEVLSGSEVILKRIKSVLDLTP